VLHGWGFVNCTIALRDWSASKKTENRQFDVIALCWLWLVGWLRVSLARRHTTLLSRLAVPWLACLPSSDDSSFNMDEWVLNTEAHPLKVSRPIQQQQQQQQHQQKQPGRSRDVGGMTASGNEGRSIARR
jgi:hypothetical protein